MNVPLLDLHAQYETIREELAPALQVVLEHGRFINGPEVKQLEQAVAEYCGCADAVGVSSGTDALLASLMTLGIGQANPACREGRTCPGCDEVITTPYTFFATGGSIWRAGARPVFVDIEPDTFNLDPSKIEAAITEKTKAVMPVHLFGQLADMDPICRIAEKHDLFVIEDAAQAIGATHQGRKAGTFGTLGCFSFFPSKNLGAMGDGGMVVCRDPDLAERLRQCRNHGSKPKYYHKWVGGNFRLDTIQAAGLLVKLKHLDDWSARRRANAARYDELFADFEPVTTPVIRDGNTSIFNQYVIRVPRRNELRDFLKNNGIGCEIYYPLSLHEQDCFKALGYKRGDFPVSEQAADTSIALPIYPELTDEQIQHVAGTVKEFLS